jgi:hypothetical protein
MIARRVHAWILARVCGGSATSLSVLTATRPSLAKQRLANMQEQLEELRARR